MKHYWIAIVLAVFGAAMGWQFGLQHNQQTETPATDYSAHTLPEELWHNLDGGENRLSEWQGKTLIINHWATWCEPCRREIPMFMAVRDEYRDRDVELIGIAHDNEEDVRRFVDSMGMDYPQLLAGLGQGRKWLAQLGSNGSLPLTLVFDREGNLRARKLGLMSEQELQAAIKAVL